MRPSVRATPTARRRPPTLIVALLVLVVVALGGTALQLALRPSASPGPSSNRTGGPAPFPPPPAPLIVSINRSGSGPVHLGYPLRVTASALGMTGVAGIELWAGGERIDVTPNSNPARPAESARWDGSPTRAGETILVARAFDAEGRTSQSAPLRLTVVQEPPRSFRLEEVVAQQGETLGAIVAGLGGDLAQAVLWNSDLPDGPLPGGTVVVVPLLDGTVPPPAGVRSGDLAAARLVADYAPVPANRPVANHAPVLATGLTIPDLSVTVTGCQVSATASGGGSAAAGFAFSALPPASGIFVALPPLAPASDGSATTVFAALGGMNYLTAASYTREASALSAIVPVNVPAACGAEGWQGDARLDGGKLVVTGAAERAYLYLKVGEEPWQRVPAAAGTFVDPVGGTFDFTGLLPPLGVADLKLEAWGWTGGSLVKLGNGTYDAPGEAMYLGAFPSTAGSPAGFGTTLDIVIQKAGGEFPEVLTKDSAVDRPGPNSQSSVKTFKWSTTLPGVTHLAWQILPYPVTDTTTITPPFLIDTGTIPVQGLSSGYFTIDLKPYLTGESSGVTSATTWVQKQLITKILASTVSPGGAPVPNEFLVNKGGIFIPGVEPGGGDGSGSASLAPLDSLALLTPPLTALYVRVIPLTGPTPAGNASNVVSFDIVEPDDQFYTDLTPPPPPPDYSNAYDLLGVFFAPTGSDPDYYDCVRVVKNGKVLPFPWGDWTNGTTHCRPKDDDGWSLADAFESFVEWVGEVWDYVSDGYSWIQDKIVEAVLTFVPCEQIANEVADNGKAVCQGIAKTALQAVMVAYGLPPEIPNWEATISAAKGDLRAYILANAKEFPGVSEACNAADAANAADSSFPTCDKLVDKAVDTAINSIVGERSSAAAASAGVVVPSGIIVEPHPRSMPQPPHFKVTVTRTSEPLPAGTVCTLSVSMTSKVENWVWYEAPAGWTGGNKNIVKKQGTVTGEPFGDVAQNIAPLAPGQSAKYDLWLTKGNVWFEPDGFNYWYAMQYAQWNGSFNHAWVLLQKGATVEGKLRGNCTPDQGATEVLTGQAYK